MTVPSPTKAELRLIEIMRADSAIGAARRMHTENIAGISNYMIKSDLHTAGDIEHNTFESWAHRKARKAAEKAEAQKAAAKGRRLSRGVTTNIIMEHAEAKAAGHTRFFTGRRCIHGHLSERYTVSGLCVQCQREQAASIRAKRRKAA